MVTMLKTYSHTNRILAGLTALLFTLSPLVSLAAPADRKASSSKKASKKAEVAQPAADTETGDDPGDYPILHIGPGDLLYIQVYGENGVVGSGGSTGVMNLLPTDYQVDSTGVIVYPFLGRLRLGGLTPVEASEKLAKLLNKPRKVTVLVKESNTYWVSVLGNVPRPGKFQIKGRPTLLSILAEAGGPLPDSDLGGSILVHGPQKTKVDLNHYLHGEGQAAAGPYLYPGDTLMVERSGWPTVGEWAIVASILASLAVVTVDLSNLRK